MTRGNAAHYLYLVTFTTNDPRTPIYTTFDIPGLDLQIQESKTGLNLSKIRTL
jgi:hypothetical protein